MNEPYGTHIRCAKKKAKVDCQYMYAHRWVSVACRVRFLGGGGEGGGARRGGAEVGAEGGEGGLRPRVHGNGSVIPQFHLQPNALILGLDW